MRREPAGQRGFTLVELMVALVLGLLIAAAAVAVLFVARQGFNSVDGGSQLRENVRFASSLIQRISVQAGFNNVSYGFFPDAGAPPAVRGYDDTIVTIVPGTATPPRYEGGVGVNGSDVLAVNFWGASRSAAGGLPADGSMINCAGIAEPQGQAVATSIFHVVVAASGEPTLVCTYRDPASGNWQSVALVQGVESLQVLYGVDGVTPNAAPPANCYDNADSVPESFLRAAQLDVGGNAPATDDNWRRVRSLRVGLVVRGPANAAVDRAATARPYAVLGDGFSLVGDPGANLTTAADGRLRQQLVFNVHLRNAQDPGCLTPP